MSPAKKLKCDYILNEIAFLEKEKEKYMKLLRREQTDRKTVETITMLKEIDKNLKELRHLAALLIADFNDK